MSAAFTQVEQEALALPAEDRARLAERLWESVAEDHSKDVVVTPELECLLDEGLEDSEQAKTTEELRCRQ